MPRHMRHQPLPRLPSELTSVAETAARAAAGTVGVIRGYDHTSRIRSRKLRAKLTARGVSVTELTPVQPRKRRTAPGTSVEDQLTLLVDLGGRGGLDAPRMAARLGLPLVTSNDIPDGQDAPGRCVLGLHQDGSILDVAFNHVELRAASGGDSRIRARLDGAVIEVPPQATFRVRPAQPGKIVATQLSCVIDSHGTTATHHGHDLLVEPAWCTYLIVRDGYPIADLTHPVHIRMFPDRLKILPITGNEPSGHLSCQP